MDNEILVGMVMLVKIGGKPVVVQSTHGGLIKVSEMAVNYPKFGALSFTYAWYELTTNPALVVQNVGGY